MNIRNRNQLRNDKRRGNAVRNITPTQNVKDRYDEARLAFQAGGFGKNFMADLWDYMRTLFESPGQAMFALLSLVGSFSSIYSVFQNNSTSSSIELGRIIQTSHDSIKLIVYILMLASISWLTSMICILLTLRINEIRFFAARAVVVLAAALNVFAIQFSFGKDVENLEFFFYAVIGIAIATFLAKTSFRYTDTHDGTIMAERAGLLVFYAVATIMVSIWAVMRGT